MKHMRAVLVTAMFLAALPFGARAQEPQKVTIDTSGWFILTSYFNNGPLNASDLPRWAMSKDLASSTTTALDDSQTGLAVRQSRFRMAIGIPNDALGGATMKGFVEADFAGALGNPADISTWMPRLRHAYVSANWKELNNLTVIVGQTWGVAPGPYFANSITHVVMPRFGGAGFLFRRAPQVKVQGDVPLAPVVSATYTAAVLTPDTSGGEKSGIPNLEARVAGQYKQNGKQMLDVGVWTHFGSEKFAVYNVSGSYAGGDGTKTLDTKDVTAQLFGVDAKLDVPYLSILGMYWQGQDIHAYNALQGGVRTYGVTDPTVASGTVTGNVKPVKTKGYMAQATVTPVKGFQIVAGYGAELPDKATLQPLAPTATTAVERIVQNQQFSAGLIYNLNAKWRLGLEFTNYNTEYEYLGKGAAVTDPYGKKTFTANQIEIGTLLAL